MLPGADAETGDGAGLLFQLPDRFLRKVCAQIDLELPEEGAYGAGMFFLPINEEVRRLCVEVVEQVVREEGLQLLGWREVPVDDSALGAKALEEKPYIAQCFVGGARGDVLERKLYVVRKQAEARTAVLLGDGDLFYVPSFSCYTMVYKGLMLPKQVNLFYTDLQDPAMESALAVVHQRYSTNTFPSWPLAQPFRHLAHNGEINTVRGNRKWIESRQDKLQSDVLGGDVKKILPVIEPGVSDSAALDNALELLYKSGRTLEHAMMVLVPQAWGAKYPMGPDLRGFFEYHAGLMEPWDGPAAIAFTDGRFVGAMLDRNGLRPARYTVTTDGFVVFASEAGVLDIPAEQVKEKGALRPGEMVLIDVQEHRLLKDVEIKTRLARRQPYRRWVAENRIDVHGFFNAVNPVQPDKERLFFREKLFGYSREDVDVVLGPMAATGHEPIGSMGADQPLAILSEKPQLLYWYFKQVFAQVTNPAIDSYREELVMSLMTFLGNTDDILRESPRHARLVKLNQPILSNGDLRRLQELEQKDFRSITLDMSFPAFGDGAALEGALEQLCEDAEQAVRDGFRLIVLSDKKQTVGRAPIPALLAVAAVNGHLTRAGLRTSIGLAVQTGEAREVMHMALLLGYGATVVNPYLAFDVVADMALNGHLKEPQPVTRALENYIKALGKGLLKIMSKMGISTLRSYRNAQVFEILGLSSEVVNRYFAGTPSRIEGLTMDGIAREVNARYEATVGHPGYPSVLPSGGQYRFRVDGERHLWTPETLSLLQQATRENNREVYRKYAALINEQNPAAEYAAGAIPV